jgi:hypothetical protein
MLKIIIFSFGLVALAILFLLHSAMNKPIYNKMHNVWEEDPVGKKLASGLLITMILIAFVLGLMF